MEIKEKLALLEDSWDLDEGTLAPGMVLEDIDDYNSMTKLALIVLMSDEFGKKLTSNQIKSFETVQDILDFME